MEISRIIPQENECLADSEPIFVQRVERTWVKSTPEIRHSCHFAKNLYNEANYFVRQVFVKTGKWVRYNTLNWIIKDVKQSKNYRDLPVQTSQQILKLVDKNWKSFFKSIKKWKTQSDKYLGRPNLPKYKKKNAEFPLLFTNQQIKRKGQFIHFPRKINFKVRTQLPEDNKSNGARILPQGIGYIVEIIYVKEIFEVYSKRQLIAGIDLGLNNLITMVNNIGEQPIVISGKKVKSINQWFNKRVSQLNSRYMKMKLKRYSGKQKIILQLKRKRQFNDLFHKMSKFVINWCVQNKIDTLVVGQNKKWKNNINLSKKINQGFVAIPYCDLIKKLKYKCKDASIEFIETYESYTSKTSFLDQEPIQKHKTYLGKRIKRGLFITSSGIVINADVNGGYNIIRKVVPTAFNHWLNAEGVVDVRKLCSFRGLHPVCLKKHSFG
ncbi:MAG: RNA-guided endonuclease InsQ/TnpB family protein [Candidatus Hodarchaeales archaeon]|jgi:putative transposase